MKIIKKTTPIRLLAMVSFLVMLALPLSAQEKNDSVFTFRFYSGKDMFIVPVMNNGKELQELLDCVKRYKNTINEKGVLLYVNGYYIDKGTNKARNRVLAKTRSNRVKSELITRVGMKESNFVTRNQPGDGNYVTVRFGIPKTEIQETTSEAGKERETDATSFTEVEEKEEAVLPVEQETLPVEDPEPASEPLSESDTESGNVKISQDEVASPVELTTVMTDSHFALKTNLLDYAILMPNLEVEWKCADRWSVALEGQIAWYAKTPPHKVYRVATVIPEVRYWVIDRSRWHGMYVGLFVGGGLYDLSKGYKNNGHEGEGGMVGVSAGYMWPIGKHLSLDAGIGFGYMRIRDKVYKPLDGHYLYQLTKNINYFGPLRLKLSLVWRIGHRVTQQTQGR